VHQLIDEPHAERLLRAHVAAGEDHVERALQPHEARQPLRAAGPRDEPELRLGQREHRLAVVGRDAIGARERELEPTAEACAVDRGDDREARLLEAVEERLPLAAHALRLLLAARGEELLDVRAGDEAVRLAADQDDGACAAAADVVEHRAEALGEPRAQRVEGLPLHVEGDDRHVRIHLDAEVTGRCLCSAHARSTTIA